MSACTHLRPININLGFCSVHNVYTLSFRRNFSHSDWSVVLYKLGRNSLLLNQIVAERKEERRPLRAQRPILQLSLHFSAWRRFAAQSMLYAHEHCPMFTDLGLGLGVVSCDVMSWLLLALCNSEPPLVSAWKIRAKEQSMSLYI